MSGPCGDGREAPAAQVGTAHRRRPRRSGSMRLASIAPMTPERTSPVPAVARPGASPGETAHAAVRRGDQRVVALEHDDRAGLGGRGAGVGEPVGLDLGGVELQQAPELAGVRREHRRRRTGAEQLAGAPGERVEPVGVDEQRRGRRGRPARARAPAPPGWRPRPGPEHDGVRALDRRSTGSRRGDGQRAVVLGQGDEHRLQQAGGERCLERRGGRDRHVARHPSAPRPGRPCDGAPVSPREPPITTTLPEVNFVDAAPRRGMPSSTPWPMRPIAGADRARRRRDPDVDHLDRAGVGLAGRDPQPGLGRGGRSSVALARTASPSTSPVEASTPLGTSAATTGAAASLERRDRAAAGSRGAPEKPVPSTASTIPPAPSSRSGAKAPARSPGSRRSCSAASPGAARRAARRRARRRRGRPSRSSRAATSPSPPLLPLPHTTAIRPAGSAPRRRRRRAPPPPAP